MSAELPQTVGGGAKKILYTLRTLTKIGLRDSAKALRSRNACKACGLGMGGQRGGMTNELGDFPAVCNKSVQAQSTDIQPAIPEALFASHPLRDFDELDGFELEHLGRLATPLVKRDGDTHFKVTPWDEALAGAAEAMAGSDPQKSFFYSSGRSSNEAGFLLQLVARLFGSNHINNCSYYCHQATGVGLTPLLGTGTATVALADLAESDCVFLIGANPASNHPRLIHQLKALRERGGSVIVINPAREPGLERFAVPKSAKSLILGGTEIASLYLQPKIGSDTALLAGIAKAVLEAGGEDKPYLSAFTEEAEEYLKGLRELPWETLCFQCGIHEEKIREAASAYIHSKRCIFAWGMGITHHRHGVENVEAISNLALLRGMVGRPGAGLLPLRGHSNVQGIGSVGVKPLIADEVLAKIETHFDVRLPRHEGFDTLRCLEASEKNEMAFALMMGGNLFAASPDLAWTQRAFDRIPKKLFLTTTLNQGHVRGAYRGDVWIFPVTARDEEWQPTTQESMFNFVRVSDGGIDRLDGVRPETEILSALAEKVLTSSALDFSAIRQHKSLRQAIAACVPGMDALARVDDTREEFHIAGRHIQQPVFPRPSGKARFAPLSLCEFTGNETFPFRMMTVRSEGQFNTMIYEQHDSYRDVPTRWSVMMSPKDMAQLNLSRKDRVTLRSAVGEMRDVEVYPFDLPQGDVMAYFPEANMLIPRDHDSRSQTPAFKSVAIAIEPVSF